MREIDRLAAIRLQQRTLRDEAKQIRQQILAGEIPLIGNDYVASIKHHVILTPLVDRVAKTTNGGASHVEQKPGVMTRWLGV